MTDAPPKTLPTIGPASAIAPALRVLMGEPGKPATLRLTDATPADAKVAPRPDDEPENALVERLRAALAPKPAALESVEVETLGVFRRVPETPHPGRVAGKVALVTGAAQGFGLGIAESLLHEGARVILADINAEGAQARADEFNRKLETPADNPRAVGLAMDVTQPASIASAVDNACRAFGGLDLLVSNAGVLKAESVKTQSPEDFDFTTRVNYRGYFLCVQAVAPVMALAHAVDPARRADIIQINSKSGLVGSNKNFAYAGGKFGGVGLTQSFALELVEDGVKVNSICPGNFFDGPLWSDPDRGLFVQYLRTGKVPGAATIDDVRRAYESKVPMGRGCTVADVMHALYYLVDQQYETGQALPVTGGQVMLK